MGRPTDYQPVPLSESQSPNTSDNPTTPIYIVPSTRRLVPYVVAAVVLLSIINFSSTENVQNLSHRLKDVSKKRPWAWNGFKEDGIEGEGGEIESEASSVSETALPVSAPAISKSTTPKAKPEAAKKPNARPGKPKPHSGAVGLEKLKLGKKPPISEVDLPNPYLYGNYLDYLKPAFQERYVTGIPLGGVNNQNKGVLSLLWLAKITNRTPILPPIIPNLHQRSLVRGPSYSTFYNLSRASSVLGFPIIEWNDIRPDTPDSYKGFDWFKNRWQEASNPLPCWVTSKMGGPKEDGGRGLASPFAKGLLLDVKGIYAPGDKTKGAWQEMNTAARFVRTNSSAAVVEGTEVEKDMACLTQTYWMKERGETSHQMQMLQTMHFTDELEALVDDIIATTLKTTPEKVRSGEARFITVHIRRGDIAGKCEPAPPNWKALRDAEVPTRNVRRAEDEPLNQPAPMSWDEDEDEDEGSEAGPRSLLPRSRLTKRKASWEHCFFTDKFILSRIAKIVNSLPGPAPSVLLTTDDKSKESLALWDSTPGIFRVNHPNVGKGRVGGEFWDVMVDAAILTRGEAFLGTGVSTMSRLAAERGKRWYKRPHNSL